MLRRRLIWVRRLAETIGWAVEWLDVSRAAGVQRQGVVTVLSRILFDEVDYLAGRSPTGVTT